jgi:DNA-binding response OmpR family regulator
MLNENEKRSKVLVLEDEPIIGRATSRTLTSEGFEVDIAENGFAAKNNIDAHNQYELMIFDIKTPGINGMQLYEYLEQQYPELTSRVIFTTGDSLGDITMEFLHKVNRQYLDKPYTPSQLKEMIRTVYAPVL